MQPFFLPKNSENCTDDKKVRIETYGCQMNVADSEVVAAMLATAGYGIADADEEAAAVVINTCSIRDNAEQKIFSRLAYWQSMRISFTSMPQPRTRSKSVMISLLKIFA